MRSKSTRTARVFLPLVVVLATAGAGDDAYPSNYVAGSLIRLNDNGAWSWFMDPRIIVDEGKVIVGSVRAIGAEAANTSDPRWGNVEMFCDSYDWYLAHRDEVLARRGTSPHRSPVKQGVLRAVGWAISRA